MLMMVWPMACQYDCRTWFQFVTQWWRFYNRQKTLKHLLYSQLGPLASPLLWLCSNKPTKSTAKDKWSFKHNCNPLLHSSSPPSKKSGTDWPRMSLNLLTSTILAPTSRGWLKPTCWTTLYRSSQWRAPARHSPVKSQSPWWDGPWWWLSTPDELCERLFP